MWRDVDSLKIAVGVPTLSNFKGLAELFSSLWGENYTPFVIANWKENIGVSKAWNEILKCTKDYDLTIICNDDVVFLDGSFKKLVEAWESRPNDAVLVTGNTHTVIAPGYHEAPDYSCFAANPTDLINRIGLFDENFTPAYFEDNDHHRRILVSGNKAYCFTGARTEHKHSQTQNAVPGKPIVTSQMFEKNRSYYKVKWGGEPGQETYINPYGDKTKDWKYWRDN